MKTFLKLAAVAAALATATVASAHDTSRGHWEWRNLPSHGPRSNLPSRVRVWVDDAKAQAAKCDCAMMQSAPADCMMSMHGKPASPSNG